MATLADLTDQLYAAHDGLKSGVRDPNKLISAGLAALGLLGAQTPSFKTPADKMEVVTALVAGISFLEAAKAAYSGKPTPMLDESIANLHGVLASAGYELAN